MIRNNNNNKKKKSLYNQHINSLIEELQSILTVKTWTIDVKY
jgi:hypothetical protein